MVGRETKGIYNRENVEEKWETKKEKMWRALSYFRGGNELNDPRGCELTSEEKTKWPDTEKATKWDAGGWEETTLSWNWRVDLEPEKGQRSEKPKDRH